MRIDLGSNPRLQVTVAVDEAKNEHEILQTFAEGADAPLE
jgi:hypothetical protein